MANLNNKKILTAEKILTSAKTLITFIEKGKINQHLELREDIVNIPIEILN